MRGSCLGLNQPVNSKEQLYQWLKSISAYWWLLKIRIILQSMWSSWAHNLDEERQMSSQGILFQVLTKTSFAKIMKLRFSFLFKSRRKRGFISEINYSERTCYCTVCHRITSLNYNLTRKLLIRVWPDTLWFWHFFCAVFFVLTS